MNNRVYIDNWFHCLFIPCVPWNADGYGYGGGNYDGGYSGGRGGARGKGTHCSVLSFIIYIYISPIRIVIDFKWHTFRLNYRPYASSLYISYIHLSVTPLRESKRVFHSPHLCSFLCSLFKHLFFFLPFTFVRHGQCVCIACIVCRKNEWV